LEAVIVEAVEDSMIDPAVIEVAEADTIVVAVLPEEDSAA